MSKLARCNGSFIVYLPDDWYTMIGWSWLDFDVTKRRGKSIDYNRKKYRTKLARERERGVQQNIDFSPMWISGSFPNDLNLRKTTWIFGHVTAGQLEVYSVPRTSRYRTTPTLLHPDRCAFHFDRIPRKKNRDRWNRARQWICERLNAYLLYPLSLNIRISVFHPELFIDLWNIFGPRY